MRRDADVLRGIAALLGTTILWASSFPVIKIAVGSSTGLGYTWMRSAIAALALLPLAARRIGRAGRATALGGVVTGIAYALGLWLQGWGTGLTTASNSAFITGL
ncbi:MAG: EamA/RhaT family transporter, partial [Thermoprotei archaeon]